MRARSAGPSREIRPVRPDPESDVRRARSEQRRRLPGGPARA